MSWLKLTLYVQPAGQHYYPQVNAIRGLLDADLRQFAQNRK